mmetsp:Transcript_16653/g.25914  ORF Transcript_16653/g.25914 Transcript_16653/m.25914 type:complete len:442 (-) Transcript_16653:31-1356(-)
MNRRLRHEHFPKKKPPKKPSRPIPPCPPAPPPPQIDPFLRALSFFFFSVPVSVSAIYYYWPFSSQPDQVPSLPPSPLCRSHIISISGTDATIELSRLTFRQGPQSVVSFVPIFRGDFVHTFSQVFFEFASESSDPFLTCEYIHSQTVPWVHTEEPLGGHYDWDQEANPGSTESRGLRHFFTIPQSSPIQLSIRCEFVQGQRLSSIRFPPLENSYPHESLWRSQVAIIGPRRSGKKTLFASHHHLLQKPFWITHRELDQFDYGDKEFLTDKGNAIRVVVVLSAMLFWKPEPIAGGWFSKARTTRVIDHNTTKRITNFCRQVDHRTRYYPYLIFTHCDMALSREGIKLEDLEFSLRKHSVPDNHWYFFGKKKLHTNEEMIDAASLEAKGFEEEGELYDYHISPNEISNDSNILADDTIDGLLRNLKSTLVRPKQVHESLLPPK